MAIIYQFGSYLYPKSVIQAAPRERSAKMRTSDTPGLPGDFTQGGLAGARRVKLSGILVAEPADDLDALWDDFEAAHTEGLPEKLYIGRDDRYLLAEVESARDVDAESVIGAIPWEIGFKASDPLYWAEDESADSLPGTITSAGNAPAVPLIELVFSSVGVNAVCTITNTTTGVATIFRVDAAVTDYEVDSAARQIRSVAGADYTNLLVSPGLFVNLVPGANVFTVAVTGGAVISSADITWRDRWK